MHQHLGEPEPVQAETSEELGVWAALDTSLSGVALGASQIESPAKPDPAVESDRPGFEVEN